MNYTIVADLKRHAPYKETTEYARFLYYEGRAMRLDWELSDKIVTGLTGEQLEEHVNSLMELQIQADLADRELVESIPVKEHDPAFIQEWRDVGFVDR